MRLFLLLALALPVQAQDFRGYSTVNQILQERLIRPGADFELGQFVGQNYEAGPNLLDLLGTYKTGGWGGSGFHNGDPNSLNMLLWHLLLSGLARDMGRICSDDQSVPYNDEILALVKRLCEWPAASAREDSLNAAFWTQTMGYDAPVDEYAEWRSFLDGLDASGAEAVEVIALTVLNNPYFLLRR